MSVLADVAAFAVGLAVGALFTKPQRRRSQLDVLFADELTAREAAKRIRATARAAEDRMDKLIQQHTRRKRR